MPRLKAIAPRSGSHTRPTRERLVRAAVDLFQAKGYHGTGLNEILELAQAPKGSLYHHFPGGKEELAVASLVWLEGEVTRFLDGVAASGGGASAMVRGIAEFSAAGLRNPRMPRGSLMAVLAQDAAPESATVAAAVRRFAAAVRDRIGEARAAEQPAGDALAFADQAAAILHGASVIARIEGRPQRAVEIVEMWLRAGREVSDSDGAKMEPPRYSKT